MSEQPLKTITALFFLSIVTLVGIVAIVSLSFAFNLSGYNMTTIVPGCVGQTYLNIKLAVVYLSLRAHTTTGLIALVVAFAAVIVAVKVYWPLKDLSPEVLKR